MRKSLSLILSVLLLHAFSLASPATDSPLEKSKKALLASKVKAGVAQLGTGKSSVVRVVLYDKTKYPGYITEIGEADIVELSRLEKVWNDAYMRGDVDALDHLWADDLIVTMTEMTGITPSLQVSRAIDRLAT